MQLSAVFLYALVFIVYAIDAVEYIYPVAFIAHDNTVLLIDQLSPTERNLLIWNPQTKQCLPGLWSLFNPAQVQLLTSKNGFSFIDNGRLRISLFNRRSPQAIDFDKPLYNMSTPQWIDEDFCYCSAQWSDRFALFQLCTDGTLCCIASHTEKDCLYPQKVSSMLFYIERAGHNNEKNNIYYTVMQTVYPMLDHKKDDSDEYTSINTALSAQIIAYFYDNPLVFLHMQSQTEGFVLSHEKKIENDGTIFFYYHQLFYRDDVWQQKQLFSFKIPASLLVLNNQDHLYEGLEPLLPRVVKTRIYFVNCANNEKLTLLPYCYNMITDTIAAITLKMPIKNHLFAPKLCGENFFIGGQVSSSGKGLVKKWYDKKKGLCVDIPQYIQMLT